LKCHAEGASLSITDSGHTKTPDFSIPVPGATHHDAPAQHDEEAVRHRQQAAELYQYGHHEKVSHHAHLASAPPRAREAACRRSRQGSHEESSRRFALKPFLEFSRERRRKQMKESTKDQVKGKLHEMKGEVKEKAGKVTNNPNLTAEGQNEKLAGKVQKKVGQIEKVFEK